MRRKMVKIRDKCPIANMVGSFLWGRHPSFFQVRVFKPSVMYTHDLFTAVAKFQDEALKQGLVEGIVAHGYLDPPTLEALYRHEGVDYRDVPESCWPEEVLDMTSVTFAAPAAEKAHAASARGQLSYPIEA